MTRKRQEGVIDEIKQIAESGLRGEQLNNLKRLQGRPGYRLRVGSYRVIFVLTDTTLTVVDVFPRGKGY